MTTMTTLLVAGYTVLASAAGDDAKGREMPDPFRFDDGSRVRTVEDWQRRRDEIREMVLKHQYGHMPPAPGNVKLSAESSPKIVNDGKSVLTRLRLTFGPEDGLFMTAALYRPKEASGRFPVVVRVGLGGELAAAANERGYAFFGYSHTRLDPDTEGHDVVGPAQAAYPDYDWGSIAVWAWGASRAVDYLVTCPWVNKDQIAVTGHSRTGKVALLAGALDERFALVVPNGSGCGGAGAYRIVGENAEDLEAITLESRWASWFHDDFNQFAKEEHRLPFDQHFMRAMVAPRLLISTDGVDDHWANPLGTQAAFLAAQPVYDFLGVPDRHAMHFRPGGHDQLVEDIEVLLDFADRHFKGKKASREFTVLPFPEYRPEL